MGNKKTACVCPDVGWIGVDTGQVLVCACEHGKDKEASRRSGNILTMLSVGLSKRAAVGGDSQLLVRDCMKMCLSNWGNRFHVDIRLLLSLYKC